MGEQGTVQINVGGEKHEVLEQTIRGKPDTLLCTLLDDPARKVKSEPLFIQADPRLFCFILSWYRYGSICLPSTVSVEEMKRECAFYQLPDTVKISRERLLPAVAVSDAVVGVKRARTDASARASEARMTALAAEVFKQLVSKEELVTSGQVQMDLANIGVEGKLTETEAKRIASDANTLAGEFGWQVTLDDARSERVRSRGLPFVPRFCLNNLPEALE
mmetsp:Transcript_44193/g.104627  ORF Transcript_44193/g.104627 Transcript_44193/m.104627 type:complete len:219 (-) Transcript_44193:268-924(-)